MSAETWRANLGVLTSFSRVTRWTIENIPALEAGGVGEEV
jgi:hypothetical protein